MAIYDIDGNRIDVGGSEEYKKIRVLSYNVGNFDNGGTAGYSGNDLDGYIAEWARFLGSCNADIALLSESRRYIDSANTVTSKNGLYSKLFNYVSDFDNGSIPWAKVLATEIEQKNVISARFNNHGVSNAGYVGAKIIVNGVEIFVVATHLIHGGDDNIPTRVLEMQELVDLTSSYENVIIGGDLNTASLGQLDTFRNAGFSLANGGFLGTQNTWNSTKPSLPLDNVLVKGNNIKIRSFELLESSLSDHLPTIAEIIVLGNS